MSFDEIVRCLSREDQKVIADVTALYDKIDRQTEEYAKETGLKCKKGCGACCENPDIETMVTEVLPLAAYLWSKGLAESIQGSIQENPQKRTCVFYKPDLHIKGHGRCGIYEYRPGLCRLFGFTARKNKRGVTQPVTCKIIKESQPERYEYAQKELAKGALKAPVVTNHSLEVASIDPVHGQTLLGINQAVKLGIQKIGFILEKTKQ